MLTSIIQDGFRRLTGKKEVKFGELGLKRDIHCHLLPGVDDGASDLAESRQILRQMADSGITGLTLTSHINPDVYPGNDEALFRKKFDELRIGVDGLDVPKLSLGAEYMVTADFHRRDPESLLQFLPGSVLIEMSYYYPSNNIEDAIFNLTSNGLTPVMAHPERYLYLADRIRVFDRICDMGCKFQLNILSLSGIYGSASVHIMNHLMKYGMYSYIASDTHTFNHFRNLINMPVPKRYLPAVTALIEGQNGL